MEPTTTLVTAPVGDLVRQICNVWEQPHAPAPILYTAETEPDALLLSSIVFDVRRARPLVVVTRRYADRVVADLPHLATTLHPTADVVDVRNSEVTRAFCAMVPSWLGVYGGYVRLYLPGTDIADDRKQHPLIKREEGSFERKIINHVTQRARSYRRSDPAAKLASTETDLERVRGDLTRARQEITRLKDSPEETDDEPVFSDPEVQFEHELHLAWLRTTPEHDRPDWGLRNYTLGPDFLASLDTVEVARRRILRACVDVVTGRYPHIPGREAKRFRGIANPTANGKPNLVRSDGAAAWRCSIAMSGIAPRLMWWECSNGEPELSRVGPHNDFHIT